MPILHDPLAWAHPLVKEWFLARFGSPTEPQLQGWPAILKDKTTLISAPTGSGKTLAAFLICIDRLVRQAISGNLKDQTQVLYVSPLKALSNDIQKNLNAPLLEIEKLAADKGIFFSPIRIAVRTGDTPATDRQKMLKKPPHILVTTPESFYILLTAEKSRLLLATIQTIIVDEIHAVANDKRGSHLSLSLERLDALTQKPSIRIGLSATQKPIEKIAHFLTGNTTLLPTIIHIGHIKPMELSIEVPHSELGAVASNEMWDEVYDRLAELSNAHRSTLVFVNTRRLAERIAHHLTERMGEEQVAAHHGSLSRKLRLAAETKLKNGELKVLVATGSLELGIDIGDVDLVVLIGSPRVIAVALQRIGRAGHWRNAISKAKIFATTRDELVECAALVYAISQGELDQLIIPTEPIDILCQQIIAACATNDWSEQDLYRMMKRAYPFAHLTLQTFDQILDMLSEGIAGSRGRYGTYLFRDRVNQMVRARRGSRLTAITNGGAIPENGLFTVVAEPQQTIVGTLDEDFAVESNRGDIILLGTSSWQIIRIESKKGRVIVQDAHGAAPTVPFWRGEAPGRSIELSLYVSLLREKIYELSCIKQNEQEAICWLKKHCQLEPMGAKQLVEYIKLGVNVLGNVPSQNTIIAERFFDEGGGMQLVIHAPFGARINKAWGLALRKKFCRSFNFELQAQATDNGLNISLSEQHSFPLADVFHFLHPNTIQDVLVQAVIPSPLFATRWRSTATRSLALTKFRYGKKIPPNILRMLADDLLAAVFPDAAACQDNRAGQVIELPDHPLINETMKEVLTDALDITGLTNLLHKVVEGKIKCLAIDTTSPSAFSHEILNANPYAYLDDAPLEERRARAVEFRRILPMNILEEVGKLDEKAILEVKQQIWPDIRNADELHDFLQTVIVYPSDYVQTKKEWFDYFAQLKQQCRVNIACIDSVPFWFAAEKNKTVQVLYPTAIFQDKVLDIEKKTLDREQAIIELIRGWLLHLGPTYNKVLQNILKLDQNEIDQALIKIENTGLILRGHFCFSDKNITEWCERRILARIHHLTIGQLRKEIAPISSVQFMQWLLKWQHLTLESQVEGEQGLIEIITQLQGFEMPANAWEKQIFAKRIKNYSKDMLDRVCLMGLVSWGRISNSLISDNQNEKNSPKKFTPTSTVPITFFIRDEFIWNEPNEKCNDNDSLPLSYVAKEIYQLLQKQGASFFNDIERHLNRLKAEIENGLWELVGAGLVTADGFDSLRALIDPRRRLKRKHRNHSLRYNSGRWSLLNKVDNVDDEKKLETICWILLKRYGVVFRDLLKREKNLPRWRELLIIFRRLEDRGEIRGGRFVDGFLGEQFALPYAVSSLRLMKKIPPKDETLTIYAADPLNLSGIILPGLRITSTSKKKIILREGLPIPIDEI